VFTPTEDFTIQHNKLKQQASNLRNLQDEDRLKSSSDSNIAAKVRK
jgi:hypothetical protein